MKSNNIRTILAAVSMLVMASLACSLIPGQDDADGGDSASIVSGPTESEVEADRGDCIVGKWAVDNTSMQAYLDTSMNEDGGAITVGEVTGNLYFTFGADGVMTLSSEDYTYDITLDTDLEDFVFDMSFVVVAEGSAHYTADGTTLTNSEQDYSFEETTLDAMLDFSAEDATMELTINPGLFIAGSEPGEFEEASTTYECSGDSLTFTGDALNLVSFIRVE